MWCVTGLDKDRRPPAHRAAQQSRIKTSILLDIYEKLEQDVNCVTFIDQIKTGCPLETTVYTVGTPILYAPQAVTGSLNRQFHWSLR